MKKTKLFSLLLLVFLAVGFLTGCGAKKEVVQEPVYEPQAQQPVDEVIVVAPELDLESEAQALDSIMNELEETGFEATTLSDQDLGL